MMNLMIKNCENDKNALMGMGKTMIKHPKMHKMMSEMLNNDESKKVKKISEEKSNENKMMETTKTVKKPKYDSN